MKALSRRPHRPRSAIFLRVNTSEIRDTVTTRHAGLPAQRRPSATFWFVWSLLLLATVLLSWWSHRSSDLPLDNHFADWLYHNHDSFPLSDQFWEYMRLAGQPSTIIVVGLVLVAALAARRRLVEAGLVLLALSTGLVQLAVRALVDRPVFSGIREPGRAYPSPSSYPSGHAFGEFLVFGLIFVFAPLIISSRAGVAGIRAVCVAVIVFGGMERVADSRHWPSDVIGAYLLALLYVSAAWWVSRAWAAGRRPQP